jgi:hypothetical protein
MWCRDVVSRCGVEMWCRDVVSGAERYVADAQPGNPCRRCRRDADIGETLILVAHDQFTSDSP